MRYMLTIYVLIILGVGIFLTPITAEGRPIETDNLSPTGWVMFVGHGPITFRLWKPIRVFKTEAKCIFIKGMYEDNEKAHFWCEELPETNEQLMGYKPNVLSN